MLLQKMLDQKRNIRDPFPKRRDNQGEQGRTGFFIRQNWLWTMTRG